MARPSKIAARAVIATGLLAAAAAASASAVPVPVISTFPTTPVITNVAWTIAGLMPTVTFSWSLSTAAGGIARYEVSCSPPPRGIEDICPAGMVGQPISTTATSLTVSLLPLPADHNPHDPGILSVPPVEILDLVAYDNAGRKSLDARVSLPDLGFALSSKHIATTFTLGDSVKAIERGYGTVDWDIDGDGTFETPDPVAYWVHAHEFTATRTGTYAVGVRRTSDSGSNTVTVTEAYTVVPPTGKATIAVAGHHRWLTSRKLKLALAYPTDTTGAAISIAGGAPATIALHHAVTLTIPRSVKQARSIDVAATYAGYQRTSRASAIFGLDTTRPRLSSAVLQHGTLHVAATDAVSGLASIQLARSSRSHPARSRPFRASLRATTATWARVIDRAGNASVWMRIAHAR